MRGLMGSHEDVKFFATPQKMSLRSFSIVLCDSA